MLNYNKIHSSISFQRTVKSTLAKFMGIANSTLIDRLDKENLTPDDIEKIADYFGRTIAYYFDREEKEEKPYKTVGVKMDVAEEPVNKQICALCAEKERLIAAYEKQIELLEFSLGKNQRNGSE